MPVEHSDHQTRHLHKWPSVMATHTILREHVPEDWEKDLRRGLPLEKCIYNIFIPYCCRHFFSLLRRPDTVQPANCKFTWTYDLPFSDHMLLAHFVSIGNKILLFQHFTNWFAGLHKKNAICGIVFFFYLQNQEILALLLRIFVWAYLIHIKMIWH